MPASDLIRNERAKLTATYFNNIAVALAAVGTITPVLGTLAAGPTPSFRTLLVGLIRIAGSGALHLGARSVLGRMS